MPHVHYRAQWQLKQRKGGPPHKSHQSFPLQPPLSAQALQGEDLFGINGRSICSFLQVVANEMHDCIPSGTDQGDTWAFLVHPFLCSAANASLTPRGAMEMGTRHPVGWLAEGEKNQVRVHEQVNTRSRQVAGWHC